MRRVAHLGDGRWWDADAKCWRSARGRRIAIKGGFAFATVRTTYVVLACAHLDHDPGNSASANLAALCQRCHMIHDAAEHRWQRCAAFTGETRLGMATVLGFVEFLLTALVFMLIGLQLRGIVERLEGYDAKSLSLIALAMSATLIVSRFVWIFPATWLPRVLSRATREADPLPPWSYPTVLS